MPSLLTTDGRVLSRSAPAIASSYTAAVAGGGVFPPMWSDGSSDNDGVSSLASYQTIYETQPVVAAAVNKIARQIATLPLKVYRRKADGERERVREHPLAQLLERPVARAGATHLKQWIITPTLIEGNGLIAKFRSDPDGPPTNLLPVDWRFVEGYAAQGGPIEWWATTQTGERRWIRVEDTLHFAWGSAGEVGVSPLKQLGVTLRLDDAAQRWATGSFRNSVTPNIAITLAENAKYDDETRRAIREGVQSLHGGPDKGGGVMVVGGGASVDTLSHTVADTQLVQQRQVSREEIAMVYDLPGPLIGDLTHGTYSNVLELYRQFYKSTLRPWMTVVEETIQAQLIDPEPDWAGLFVEFDAGEILRGDKTEEIAALVSAVGNGLMTHNEGRQVLNLPAYDEEAADKPHIPVNNLAPLGSTPIEPPAE